MVKKKNPFKNNKYEIKYHIINSLIAGLLVLFGSFAGDSFTFTLKGVMLGVMTSIVTALIKFQQYWGTQENEYCKNILNFI